MITPQLVFFVAGIVLLVVAVVLAIVAAVYFFRQNIRGVMDDLSGRTRQQHAGTDSRRSGRSKRHRDGVRAQGPDVVPDQAAPKAPAFVSQPAEDELDTVLDTKLRKVPQRYAAVSPDGGDANDDIPTVVTSLGQGPDDADVPTTVESDDDIPTQVEAAPGDATGVFRVTRSIVAIHTNEVITAG